MALDKLTLKNDIKAAFEAAKQEKEDANKALDDLSAAISNAIDAFVKGADVSVASGIPVETTGTADAQSGSTVETGSGTIS